MHMSGGMRLHSIAHWETASLTDPDSLLSSQFSDPRRAPALFLEVAPMVTEPRTWLNPHDVVL